MEEDSGRDVYPVKDQQPARGTRTMDEGGTSTRALCQVQDGHQVVKWTREELEDRFFHTHDENVVLKKHARKQEDRIKRISTKLVRLMNDRKKMYLDKNTPARKRDVDTEQIIEEQQDRIRELERQNKLLQERLIVVRQQCQLRRPVPAGYRHISSRVDTGLPRYPTKLPNSTNNAIGRINNSTFTMSSVDKSEPAVNEAVVSSLREQLEIYEDQISNLREKLSDKQSQYEDEIRSLKSQLSCDHRQTLRENVSIIRLQRELKHKSSQLLALEARCLETEESLKTSRLEYEQLLVNADDLGEQLRDEQQKNSSLQSEVVALSTVDMMVAEYREKITDLEKENAILRDSNRKILDSALDYDKFNKKFAAEVERHKQQPNKSTTSDSSREELVKEREIRQMLNTELNQLRIKFGELQEQRDELVNQLQSFSKINEANFTNNIGREELLEIRRHQEDRLKEDVVSTTEMTLKTSLTELQADHAETISELEKTRDMLVVQHRINKDCQADLDNLTSKLMKVKQDYEDRLSEQTRLLELKVVTIQRLEHQLNDFNSSYLNVRPKIIPNQPEVSQPALQAFESEIIAADVSIDESANLNDKLPESIAVTESLNEVVTLPTPKPRSSTPKRTTIKKTTDRGTSGFRSPPIAPPRETLKIFHEANNNKEALSLEKPKQVASFSDSDSDSDDEDVIVSTSQTNETKIVIGKRSVDSEDDDEDEDEDEEAEEEEDEEIETDSDIVVSHETSKASIDNVMNKTVVILVSDLSFTPNSPVLNDHSIRTLFVEYRFLDFPAEELETPFSLPRPNIANQRIVYNFRKEFRFDLDENKRRCQLFMNMISGSSKETKRITFTVVSEPSEDDEEAECEDVGYAYVDIGKIFTEKKDIVDEKFEVWDAKNKNAVIGHLGVSIQAVSAINLFKNN